MCSQAGSAQMGLPVEKLIVASNQNDILTRFFASGTMQRRLVDPSLSPSMDIQVSSNFERSAVRIVGQRWCGSSQADE